MADESTQGRKGKKKAERKMKERSDVWPYFTRSEDNKDGKEKARCKRCQNVLLTIYGTGSLRKHKEKCWGQEPAPVEATALPRLELHAPSRPGGSSDRDPGLQEQASKHLARMIALRGHDPSFLEDHCFKSFVRSLNSGFEVPKRVAIEEMCDSMFDEAKRDLLERIKCAPGRVSLSVGRAKIMEEVLYVACHFIYDEWNLHRLVLHARVTGDDHDYRDGPVLGLDFSYGDMATDVMETISYCGIDDKRLFMVAYETTDEDELEDLFQPVLDFDTDDPRERYLDNVLHSIARSLLDVPSMFFTEHLYMDMSGLNLTRKERLQLLSELDLDYEWAYDEHWCARYYSLEVLRKRGFTMFVCPELYVKLFCKVWEQLYRSIRRISASTTPTSNLCLPELLKLRQILQAELAWFDGQDADIQGTYDYFDDGQPEDVLREASNTLDEAIKDSYLVWSVPLALDPRYKLRYIKFIFEMAFDSEEAGKYILEVTTKINKLYADYIKEYGTITAEDQSDGSNAAKDMDTTSADQWEQAWKNHRRSQDIMAAQVNSCQTELDRYLQDPLAPETIDVLNWWKAHGSEYPMVARMARDALAMPTCSKLSSDQLAQVRSILRGYSKKPFRE